MLRRMLLLLILSFQFETAQAGGGPLGIDHKLGYDNSGIWKRSNQQALFNLMVAGEIAGGLWEGDRSRFGRTMWQSIDASLIAGIATEAGKRIFTRPRPIANNDPNLFFQGGGNYSFPSGEVGTASAIVTPLILEYREDSPWVYGLEVLPVYDMIARMKVQAHWQSDVLAGFAIGTAAGFYAHSRPKSLSLQLLPGGFSIGLRHRF